MARWRRLERIRNKLVRCSQVGHTTHGDIVSDPIYLAIHPYRRKYKVPYSGGDEIFIGDQCVFSIDPPEGKIERFDISYEIWPGSAEWAQWIAAGAPDDWNKGSGTKTTTYHVYRIGVWYKEMPEDYIIMPQVPSRTDNKGRTIIDREYVDYAPLDGFGLSNSTPDFPRKEYDPGEQPGHPVYEVLTDGTVIGAYMPPIVEGTGEEKMDYNLRKYIYRFIPYYVGFRGSAKAIIEEREEYSSVTFPSGRVHPSETVTSYYRTTVGFEIRVWKRPGDEEPWIEFIGDGHPSASIGNAGGGEEEKWEDLPDPDVPKGIDYKPGAMG